jgi:hypothetical protein
VLSAPVRVARVAEHVAQGDARSGHGLENRDEGDNRIDMTTAQRDAPDQLGNAGPTLVGHHGRRREEVAEEEVLFGHPGTAVPPGGLGVGAGRDRIGGWPGEGLLIAPVDRQRRGRARHLFGHRRLDEGVEHRAQCVRGHPVGRLLFERAHHEGEGVLDLTIGEGVLGATPVDDHAEAQAIGARQGNERAVGPAQMGGPVVGRGQEEAEEQGAHAELSGPGADRQHRLERAGHP